MRKIFFVCFLLSSFIVTAQQNITLHCADSVAQQPLEKVTIIADGVYKTASNAKGIATLTLSNGNHKIVISSVGYSSKTFDITVPLANADINIVLQSVAKEIEDVVVIASTRNNQKIENAPIKVEVLGKEEMTEESTIKPANIASILGDVSGVQIQQSSAVTGNASVRIQGLDGRYTQILKDGLPLYDGFSGGFGVLSIPPLDLKQVELIKGSASTLFGGGAIGGLVNIITKKPTATPEHTIILNQSTLKESNISSFFSHKYKSVGYTLYAGYTNQTAVDVDGDGFTDVPQIKSYVVHPRLFFYTGKQSTITAGYTATIEQRRGGDIIALDNHIDTTHRYFEDTKLNRQSIELSWEKYLPKGKKLELKTSTSFFNRTLANSDYYLKGNQVNYFSELSLFIPRKKNNTVLGINYTGDVFKKTIEYVSSPLQNFTNTTFGAFAQHTIHIQEKTTIDVGLRNDYHTTYGNKVLPRVAMFHRFNQHWATRAGIGFGYKTPNVLAPQNIDYALNKILPVASTVIAEKSIGYNAEVNYKKVWSEETELFVNCAFFLTRIKDPIVATENSLGYVSFANAAKPMVSKGFDIYVQGKIDDVEVYLGYTFTSALRKYETTNQFVPLTPKHRFATTIVKEFEPNWRIGIEASYNGQQHRYDGTKTPAYLFMAAMIERKFGKHCSVVLNAENILDYRQSKVEAINTGSTPYPNFQPLWAPIDGRVVNLSVKYKW